MPPPLSRRSRQRTTASVTSTTLTRPDAPRRCVRQPSARHWHRRHPERVARLGPPRPQDDDTYATVSIDEHGQVVNVEVSVTAHRACLAEERVLAREMRVRGVVESQLSVEAQLSLWCEIHQRLAARRLARAYRPIMIRALRPRGRARRVQRVHRAAARRATADSGGGSDGDGEPPRRGPRARGPPRLCAWLA